MRHSIFSVILMGIFLGALFFFMPHLIIGIILIFVIIRLLHVGFMGHGWYGRGYYGHRYGRGCDCGYGYDHGYECDCECGCGHEYYHGNNCHHDHHHGHGPMQGHIFHWADKIRNMSEEEFTEYKEKMNKGFGYGFYGRNSEGYRKCKCGEKSETECNCEPTEKKEETTK